jgi:hypothetical protein
VARHVRDRPGRAADQFVVAALHEQDRQQNARHQRNEIR